MSDDRRTEHPDGTVSSFPGYQTVYGDAARTNTLLEAGIKNAHALVLSASNVKGECEIVRQAQELNSHIRIIARTTYLSDRQNLIAAGADVVFSDEGEVALSVMEMILKQFGATPDQINRERKRVHESFVSTPSQAKKKTDQNQLPCSLNPEVYRATLPQLSQKPLDVPDLEHRGNISGTLTRKC